VLPFQLPSLSSKNEMRPLRPLLIIKFFPYMAVFSEKIFQIG